MADDSISVVIGADISGLTAGMKEAGTVVANTANQVKESFQSVGAADTAVSKTVNNATTEVVGGFVKMKTGGIFAFDALRAKVIESTAEVGRLRAEILETDDSAKLTQLHEQLRRAQAEMAAARTEMRALRMETAESTEKLNLFGEAAGVRIPGELGRLISKFPAVQSAMATAFEAGVILFFIHMIGEAVNKVAELAEEIGGFGKEAQKSYQQALDYNTKMIVQQIELKEKLSAVSLVGKEGAAKYAQETLNSKDSVADLNAEITRLTKSIERTHEEIDHLTKIKAIGEIPTFFTGGLPELNKQLDELHTRTERMSKELEELEGKRYAAITHGATAPAEEKQRTFEQDIKNNEARVNAVKEYNEALINYESSEYRRRYALGEISLEQEISLLQDAERRKLAIEEEAYRKRRALKLEETKTATGQPSGKNVAPEIIAMDEKMTQSRAATNEKINTLDEQLTTGTIRRTKETSDAEISANLKITESTLKNQEVQERFSLSQARSIQAAETAAASLIRTETSLFESQLVAVQQKADVLVNSLSIEQRPTAKLGTNEFSEELKAIKELKPQIYAQLLELNTQETTLRSQLSTAVIGIEEQKSKKIQEINAKTSENELNLAVTTSNRALEATLKTDDQRLSHHQITLGKWQADELAALNNWYAAQLEALKRAEDAAAQSFGTESQEYARLKNKEIELDQQYANKSQQINQKVAESWAQVTQRMASAFSSAVNSVLQGHEKIGQAALKLGMSLELYIIDQGIKKVVTKYGTDLLQMLADHSTWLASLIGKQTASDATTIASHQATVAKEQAIDIAAAAQQSARLQASQVEYVTVQAAETTALQAAATAQQAVLAAGDVAQIAQVKATQVAEITTNAGEAGAAGFASVMEALPFPVNVATAPGVAAAAAASTLGFLAFEEGGIVPGSSGRQPVLVHGGEVITHSQTLNALNSPSTTFSSSTSNHAMRVERDQISMVEPGMVVVPKAMAGDLASVIQSKGGNVGTAEGITPPNGIKEVPQRLPSNVSSTIGNIISQRSARDGYVSTTRDLFSAKYGFAYKSAREGYAVPGITSAAGGMEIGTISSAPSRPVGPLLSPGATSVLNSHSGSSASTSPQNSPSSSNYNTMHNHVRVEVNNNGGKEIDHDKIVASVRQGIRTGAIRLMDSL